MKARLLPALVAATLVSAVASVLAGCGGKGSPSNANAADASPEGASTQEAIGAWCTPSEEISPTFAGFSASDVALDANNPACGGGVCVVNHFQGLTSCPYGQSAQGMPPAGEKACTVPGTGQPVTQTVKLNVVRRLYHFGRSVSDLAQACRLMREGAYDYLHATPACRSVGEVGSSD